MCCSCEHALLMIRGEGIVKQVKAILLGAGARGALCYAPYATRFPHELQFVAVAEPQQVRRDSFAADHKIPEDNVTANWEDLLNRPKFADAVIICTQDRMHYEPAKKALELGYHVLIEKPMSPVARECLDLELSAIANNRLLTTCFVLRYTSFWSAIKKVIVRGDIGNVVSIQLNENVGYYHMAHSYVRGNWRNRSISSPMILAKSSHDMDLIGWLIGEKCMRVGSFGSLFHFHEGNAPIGATDRCTDGCPHEKDCPFAAAQFYLNEDNRVWAAHFTTKFDHDSILEQLRVNSYGRCVYKCDNDVVDHQVVNMEFENGATALFSMSGFTHDCSRQVQIMGTKGEIRGSMEANQFSIYDFLTSTETVVKVRADSGDHGGGDHGLIRSFVADVASIESGNTEALTPVTSATQGHMMAFAAEESRLQNGTPIELKDFIMSLGGEFI